MRTTKSNRVQSPTKSNVVLVLLLLVALLMRIWHLDFIPGLNGDEAWLAVQIRDFLAGVDYSFKTPSQRIPSPLHWVLVAASQLVPLTNIWILRLPTLIASLLTPIATFYLFKKSLNFRALWTLTLLSAALPVNLAFARNMGEMSQVPLVGAFIFGFLWQQRWLAATLSYLVGLTVYPTNIFLDPIVLLVLGYQQRKKINWWSILKLAPIFILFTVTAIYFCLPPNGFYELWQTIMANMQNPSRLFEFTQGYFRLFSGVITYLDFSGPLSATQLWAFDVISWVVIGGPLAAGSALAIKDKNLKLLWFLAGYVLMLALIYLLAQRSPFDVGYERYALFIVFPTLLLWTLFIEEIFQRLPWLNKIGIWWVMPLIVALLVSFEIFYMQKFKVSGGEAHNTYRTTQPEPKLQAFEWIQKDHKGSTSLNTIVVEDWWLYWTMRYFNSEEQQFKIYGVDEKIFEFAPSRFLVSEIEWISLLKNGGYVVGFWGDPLFQKIEALRLSGDLPNVERSEIKDRGARPILAIWRAKSL